MSGSGSRGISGGPFLATKSALEVAGAQGHLPRGLHAAELHTVAESGALSYGGV